MPHTGEFSDNEISLIIRIYSQRPGIRTSCHCNLLLVLVLSVFLKRKGEKMERA
jgi:hypothetical protein